MFLGWWKRLLFAFTRVITGYFLNFRNNFYSSLLCLNCGCRTKLVANRPKLGKLFRKNKQSNIQFKIVFIREARHGPRVYFFERFFERWMLFFFFYCFATVCFCFKEAVAAVFSRAGSIKCFRWYDYDATLVTMQPL